LGNAVQVFSIQARRPIRILQIEKGGHVTGIKTSPLDPQHIYVSTSSGNLVRVNWESNNEAGKWTRLGEAICCEIIHVNVQDKEHIAYFSVTKKGPEQWVIKVNTFLPSQPGNSTETVVLESSKLLDRLQVLQDGHAIVACAGQHAVIGTLTQKQNKKSPFSGYVWREVRLPVSKITSFDAREARAQPSDKATSIDLAIGEASGAILLYQDILGGGSSGDIAKNGLPLLQRLHWHREAVSSVRWSRDGMLLYFRT
jgi:NET1-associated nuclear protein 1 (U3 small nucleolar RNA-associated protein 17)